MVNIADLRLLTLIGPRDRPSVHPTAARHRIEGSFRFPLSRMSQDSPATATAPLKKTAAIRLARQSVPNPVLATPSQFVVRVPVDARRPADEVIEVLAVNYLEAQRIRAHAVARVALVMMGLEHIELRQEEGSTIEQLMDVALQRAHQPDAVTEEPAPFWRVPIR